MTRAYYNEFDPHAAAWLRELIKAGEIAPGDVDERSITDVNPTELLGYTQLHFFAGIGGWSRALRLAGIGDDVRIVTGSCPCQPFSSAGKGDGFDDPRHLWPHFFRIIQHLRPARVVGEQVASPDALVWWDAVCTDLEGSGYAGWAADLCSAGIGAPHIRQRLYWVANSNSRKCNRLPDGEERLSYGAPARWEQGDGELERGEPIGRLADPRQVGREPLSGAGQHREERDAEPRGGVRGVADAEGFGRRKECPDAGGGREGDITQGRASGHGAGGGNFRTGPLDSIRRDADWLHCRDGRWRPVKPGLVPLVDGLPRGVVPSSRTGMAFDPDKTAEARAMRLKGYGNAIDPELAAMFLRAVS